MKGHGVLVPKNLGQSLGEWENKRGTCNMSNILLTPLNIWLCMELTQLSFKKNKNLTWLPKLFFAKLYTCHGGGQIKNTN